MIRIGEIRWWLASPRSLPPGFPEPAQYSPRGQRWWDLAAVSRWLEEHQDQASQSWLEYPVSEAHAAKILGLPEGDISTHVRAGLVYVTSGAGRRMFKRAALKSWLEGPGAHVDGLRKLLTADEAASIIGVASHRLASLAARGMVKSIRMGKLVRYRTEDLTEIDPVILDLRHPFSGQQRRACSADDAPTAGGVYFIDSAEAPKSLIKIGWSTNIRERLLTLQCGSPVGLRLVAWKPATSSYAEKEEHDRWAKYRVRGEWFSHEGRLREYVRSIDGSV